MASLFFLPSDTTAAVSPTPDTAAGQWDGHVNTVSRQLLSDGNGSAAANTTYDPDAVDHLVDLNSMVAQFVSAILPVQTIPAGTVRFAARCLEASATNNLFLTWKLYAVNAAGTSVLGTLVALRRDATEMAGALTGRIDTVTSTAFAAAEPFRLVLEVGGGGLPTAGGTIDGHNCTINFGCDTAVQSFVADNQTFASIPFLSFFDVDIKFGQYPFGGLHRIEAGIGA